jgi:flagellar biosynthesis protein FliQ
MARPLRFSLSGGRVPVRLDSRSAMQLRRYQILARLVAFFLAPVIIAGSIVGLIMSITAAVGSAHSTGLGGLPILLALLLVMTALVAVRIRPAQYPVQGPDGWVVYRHVNHDCFQQWALRYPDEVMLI